LKQRQTVQSVELSTIAHATDDLEKIQTALNLLLPESIRGRQLFTRRYLQGHYGNPITTFEAHLTNPEDVEEFKAYLLKHLAEMDRSIIVRELDRHTDDEGNLYIRIDKQRILRGNIRLGQDDPVRVRMKFTKFAGKTTALMTEYLESE
jgi:RNA binding exosome subunit